MLKSFARPPRISLSSQFSAADLAIVILFALGGLGGFPGFAKYSDIKTQIASLDHKVIWAAMLFLFIYLLIYRKIRKCYFSMWLARIHALLINAGIAAACWMIAKLSFLSTMGALDVLIAIQSGLAAVYLVVQGWIDFKPDLRSLGRLADEIEAETSRIEGQYGDMVESGDVTRAADLCIKFVDDTKAVLLDSPRDAVIQEQLDAKKGRVDRILQALKAPLPQVSEALKRAKAA